MQIKRTAWYTPVVFTIDNYAGDCRFPEVGNYIPVDNLTDWTYSKSLWKELSIFSNKTYCYWSGSGTPQSLVTIPGSDVVATGTHVTSTTDYTIVHSWTLGSAARAVPDLVRLGTDIHPENPARTPVFYCVYTSLGNPQLNFSSQFNGGGTRPTTAPFGTTVARNTTIQNAGLDVMLADATPDPTGDPLPSTVYLTCDPTPSENLTIKWEIRLARTGGAYMASNPKGTAIAIYRAGLEADPWQRLWYYTAGNSGNAQELAVSVYEDLPSWDFRSVLLNPSAVTANPNVRWNLDGLPGTIAADTAKAWFMGEERGASPSFYDGYGTFIQSLFGVAGWQFHIESGTVASFDPDTGALVLNTNATGDNQYFNTTRQQRVAIPLDGIPEYSGNIATVCIPSFWDSAENVFAFQPFFQTYSKKIVR